MPSIVSDTIALLLGAFVPGILAQGGAPAAIDGVPNASGFLPDYARLKPA